jgi:hypothetical protein
MAAALDLFLELEVEETASIQRDSRSRPGGTT